MRKDGKIRNYFRRQKGHAIKILRNTGLENPSILDIVSVQRGNILDWFLNDVVSVAASAHSYGRIERTSGEKLRRQKAQVYCTVELSEKST